MHLHTLTCTQNTSKTHIQVASTLINIPIHKQDTRAHIIIIKVIIIYYEFLLRCGTLSDELGTEWDSNSLVKVYKSSLVIETPPEAPTIIKVIKDKLLLSDCTL